MKFWITGANGFLGKTMQNTCRKKEVPFIATGKDEVDISSLDQVNRFACSSSFNGITHIINCAALAHVDLAEKNWDAAFGVNVLGPENLGKIASERNIPVIHFSTEYIFNGCKTDIPFKETDLPEPIGAYGVTKREGEVRLLAANPRSCIIRTSWLFGGEGKTFLSSLLERIKRDKTLQIAADQKNRPTYVVDLTEAVFLLLNYQGIIHFANQGEASRYEIALQIKERAIEYGIPITCDEIIPLSSDRFAQINQRPVHCVMDTTKFEQLFQEPIRSWKETVKDLIQSSSQK